MSVPPRVPAAALALVLAERATGRERIAAFRQARARAALESARL